uniref:MAK10-like protein n=1 Tax=Tanacetum cinerariifolium TaxID=118510 RepID=A0A6L2M3W3_TANCI|nr:hypothetical protein [Tanacetum cinerariifolium]
MGDENPIRTLGDYSKPSHEGYRNTIELPVGNNVIPLRSDPSGWCKTNAHSTDFGPRIQTNTSRIFLNLWTHLTLLVKIGKKRACVYFNSLFAIKLAVGLNVFQHDPSPHGRILLPDSLLNSFYREGPDFTKPVKAITLPQDVSSTSERHLIELETQVQCLMEAHLAPTQPTQVKKITTSCEICNGTHDTQYCMENPEQAFVDYASSHTDEAGGKWYTFKPEQNNLGDTYNPSWRSHPNLRWRQPQNSLNNFSNPPNRFQPSGSQSEMTNKIDTVLKAITDRIAGKLPSDTVKNPKISATSVLSARSYPTIDPQFSSHPSNPINAIKAHFKEATIYQTSLQQPKIETEPPQPEELEPTLEDEFQDLHLNLPILEVLAHAPIYNVILDKYAESLELGKAGSAFVQEEISIKKEDPSLFTLPCRLRGSKPFNTLADLGLCVNIIPLYLFKKLIIRLLEETDHIFGLTDGTKSYPIGIVKRRRSPHRKTKTIK